VDTAKATDEELVAIRDAVEAELQSPERRERRQRAGM